MYSYKFNGQSKRLTIGRYPALPISEARKLCSDAQLLKDKGIDPSQLKKDESDKKNIERTNTLSYYLAHQYKDHMERAIAQDSYLALIRNHFPDLLEKSLSDINKDDLIAWRKIQMNKYYNDEKGYASASIGSRYSALKSLMSYAVRNKVIQSNPFDLMEKLEFSKDESTKQQAKRTYLTKEQQKSLLLSITNYDEKLRSERRNSRSHGQSHLPDLDNLAFASHHKPMLLIHFYMGLRGAMLPA